MYTVQYILQQQEIIRNETKIRTGTENVRRATAVQYTEAQCRIPKWNPGLSKIYLIRNLGKFKTSSQSVIDSRTLAHSKAIFFMTLSL